MAIDVRDGVPDYRKYLITGDKPFRGMVPGETVIMESDHPDVITALESGTLELMDEPASVE